MYALHSGAINLFTTETNLPTAVLLNMADAKTSCTILREHRGYVAERP